MANISTGEKPIYWENTTPKGTTTEAYIVVKKLDYNGFRQLDKAIVYHTISKELHSFLINEGYFSCLYNTFSDIPSDKFTSLSIVALPDAEDKAKILVAQMGRVF